METSIQAQQEAETSCFSALPRADEWKPAAARAIVGQLCRGGLAYPPSTDHIGHDGGHRKSLRQRCHSMRADIPIRPMAGVSAVSPVQCLSGSEDVPS
jgi:hypothetical protein